MELKCIKEKCSCYWESDSYYETCKLVSRYLLLDKCYGLSEVQNKKEEITCQIAKLVSELEYLNGLENLVRNNQI